MNINGRRNKNATKYLSPANVMGGISFRPFFIIINEVDQRKVTSSAENIAAVLDMDLVMIILP